MAVWQVGSATVQRIEEQIGPANVPVEVYFPTLERTVLDKHLDWLVPNHYLPETDRFITSVHSWLIRTPRHNILIDCCAGNHKDRPWTPRFHQLNTKYLDRLSAAGVSPKEIDFVCCTHLHADHAGWNTLLQDGQWVPTFPRAKYIFSRLEVAYWDPRTNPAMGKDPRSAVFVDSVLPVITAGRAVLVDAGYTFDNLTVEASSGHSPGHSTFVLSSSGQQALFCGDAIHHAIQVYAPHWNHMADEDPGRAQDARFKLLHRCSDEKSLLFPVHFGAPHVVQVHRAADAFEPEFIEASHDG